MKLSTIAVGTLCLGLMLGGISGCDDEEPTTGTGGAGGRGGSGGSTGGSGGSGGSTGGSGGSTGGSGGSTGGGGGSGGGRDMGGSETGSAMGYATVKPIFAAKCTPCHMTGGTAAIFHTLASSSTDAKKNASSCPGKTKGACTIDRIKAGQMPQGKMCTGNPAMDTANAACLTASEQATLQAWITAGTPD